MTERVLWAIAVIIALCGGMWLGHWVTKLGYEATEPTRPSVVPDAETGANNG